MSTKIEWTQETVNPVVGCSWCSAGCDHCYAETMARRLAAMGRKALCNGAFDDGQKVPGTVDYVGTVGRNGRWNGRVVLRKEELKKPLGWRKPRRVFVCSMGDLFHKAVPDRWIEWVWAMMAVCPDHTFQVLTKRPERMSTWLNRRDTPRKVWTAADRLLRKWLAEGVKAVKRLRPRERRWPLNNVWVGCTAEYQEVANERVPLLMECPGPVRFVSVEPMLGPVSLADIVGNGGRGLPPTPNQMVDWVICGGESGTNARAVKGEWVVDLVTECIGQNIPVFFKQWGDAKPTAADGVVYDENGKHGGCKIFGAVLHEYPNVVQGQCCLCGVRTWKTNMKLGMCPECF